MLFERDMKENRTLRITRFISWTLPGLLILLLSTCKDPFEAEGKFKAYNFLVVEGCINAGPGITQIKLSRTTPLNQTATLVSETAAQVNIENGDNELFPLTERAPGIYATDSIDLPVDNTYRITIETSGGDKYTSAFVRPLVTPPIDSVSWTRNFEGVTIYVSTHDPDNIVRYYQWDYDEAWEILSYFRSTINYVHPNIVSRTEEEERAVYRCWKYSTNPETILASTETLSESIIRQKPLFLIKALIDDRLTVRYSMVVKQHALSKEEFDFLQIIRKNSNDLGTFFDAQPSQVFGNISSESNKTAIGFISAYTTQAKQLIIINTSSFGWRYSQTCEERKIPNDSLSFYSRYYTLTDIWAEGFDDDFKILGAYAATHVCVDCHARGGTNIRPSFWPTNTQP